MAITLCTVSGTIADSANNGISGVTVSAFPMLPFFHLDGTYISNQNYTATTDSNGAWSMAVIETTSVSKKLCFKFDFPSGNGTVSQTFTAIVPATATANFSAIVSEV